MNRNHQRTAASRRSTFLTGRRLSAGGVVLAMAAGLGLGSAARAAGSQPALTAVPTAHCGPGSVPETGIQGRVSARDVADGRAAKGYSCNMATLSHYGQTGGYRVYRYVDRAGHVCAFYDTTLLFPTNALEGSDHQTGVNVLDMTDVRHPVLTADLQTPAMQTPHESLSLNTARGLLAADMGNPTEYPGVVDVYSVAQDCRHPVLDSSLPIGILGHEGTFSPDGQTFWVSSAGGGTLSAVDLANPTQPRLVWTEYGLSVHGLRVSDDGRTLYIADMGERNKPTTGIQGYSGSISQPAGLTILDVSQIQMRRTNPTAGLISHLTWSNVTIPQVPLPVRIHGHPYVVEDDEFATSDGRLSAAPSARVGAARVIDLANPYHPRVVSNIRLQVNNQPYRTEVQNDPGTSSSLAGYAAHYCAAPQENDPGIVACSFILSGLRVFDIRDPCHPREIAYFNAPVHRNRTGGAGSNYDMSAATFDIHDGQIWYSDGNDGFYALRVSNGVWPFRS